MDRNESANEGGSSPDTVIARSSSEEERNRLACSTSGEYVTVGDSSSSLDTVTSVGTTTISTTTDATGTEDKKRGRFGALKSSFRKEGGLFKIKKKSRQLDEPAAEPQPDVEEKETDRKQSPVEEEDDCKNGGSTTTLKKKKKKSNSLVRKLSLNKFRLSTEQEPRHTPEGGDNSRLQSQSSQESPSFSDSSSGIARKRQEVERLGYRDGYEAVEPSYDVDREKGEPRKPEKQEKLVSSVTVVQSKSPSFTIRSFNLTSEHDSEQKSPRPEARCSSTLPYAISKWSEQKARPTSNEPTKKPKLYTKSESESSISKSSVREVRRKLSLLEEKRAIFQRRLFETSQDTDSGETVIAISIDDENKTSAKEEENRVEQNKTKKKARHISVKKFDTFSTFEGTFDEETGIGYLAGIEEDYTESYERQRENYVASMGPMMADSTMEKSKVNQESMSSQNNSPNAGLGEKREHLYKILVIGELGAGKTSIIKRYVHQFFSQHYRATIGVDFALKVLNWDPHTIIRLQLWDIAGQERFGNMTRVYYKEAVGAFIVFDVTRSATLDAVVKWKQDLDSKVQLPDGSPIPCVLLANKCDQQKEGLVNSPAKMDEYCKEKNFAGWFETSAKENINIEEAARFLVNKILQNDQLMKGNGSQDQTDGERFALNQSPNSSKKSCSC
ncbi:EF-hand calcium-binding domain-containing protein 4B-like [Apis laboriosa]|uniref:EF-hand calcium-binding domain-containing protein 4B-like n=1 Tax=Apis laboriosa TaxID=183418 RepID=UPI001CC6729F|nr:EF-hand calcium-binding domain-containing protein 4B-like [Apis laboriosa]XP_043790893.1 EF-hand calcium-binding domain-containing protein 4B-like [Apis laboriosa]